MQDPKPKIAIIHDFLYVYAGAERVLEQMINVFPDADLFSLFNFLPPEKQGFIQNKPVTTSVIQRIPFSRSKHRHMLPLMPMAIEQLDVSPYDIVLSSSYVAAKGIITRPDQLHICYCHSPVRYAWDMQHQYLAETGLSRGIKSMIARSILHYIRTWDARSSNSVDVFLANSDFVGRRIRKFYRRAATTLYPPVDVKRFPLRTQKQEFYFTCSRLVPYKRIDLIVQAFSKRPNLRLIVVGDGPEMPKIKQFAGPNVKLLGYQNDAVLSDYMQRAKAFVFAAEEDFGIVPVEAMAAGTPVIAFARGGVTESVIEGETGLFFDQQTPESLLETIDRFESLGEVWDAAAISRHAATMSIERFQVKYASLVMEHWEQFIGDPSRAHGGREVERLKSLRLEPHLSINQDIQVPPVDESERAKPVAIGGLS